MKKGILVRLPSLLLPNHEKNRPLRTEGETTEGEHGDTEAQRGKGEKRGE